MKCLSRILAALCAVALLAGLAGCAGQSKPDDARLKVICTLFPPYDFVRQIAGDAVDVSLLLAPGQECHSYEPTPRDILNIGNCDLFLYGGGESEAWVEDMLASVGRDVPTLAMMDCVETVAEQTNAADSHGEIEQDEHVWTSPANAMRIVAAITDTLCALDERHAAAYRAAAATYTAQLTELDHAIRATVAAGNRRTLVFADRFPFRYFADAYGLDCHAAFPGCESHAEPSAATVAALIDRVKADGIPVVLYVEFSNQKLADTVCEATGAQKYLFHSCHNVTAEEFAAGVTYLSLMTNNLNALREALA